MIYMDDAGSLRTCYYSCDEITNQLDIDDEDVGVDDFFKEKMKVWGTATTVLRYSTATATTMSSLPTATHHHQLFYHFCFHHKHSLYHQPTYFHYTPLKTSASEYCLCFNIQWHLQTGKRNKEQAYYALFRAVFKMSKYLVINIILMLHYRWREVWTINLVAVLGQITSVAHLQHTTIGALSNQHLLQLKHLMEKIKCLRKSG